MSDKEEKTTCHYCGREGVNELGMCDDCTTEFKNALNEEMRDK